MAVELTLPFQPADGNADEEALILAAQAGNRAAFGRLYERYGRLVHGIALAYVPHADAADLVQDVFLHAIERLPSLHTPQAFGCWLSTMARRTAIDALRRKHPMVELPPELPSRDANHAEAHAVLAKIRELPEAYRETMILRLVEGLTGPEISRQTGLTPDSVRVNLHRGMKLLREQLKGCR